MRPGKIKCIFLLLIVFVSTAGAQTVMNDAGWRMFTGVNEPESGWQKLHFNDDVWRKGAMPFQVYGSEGTPLPAIRTTNYFRNEFDVMQPQIFDSLQFIVHADDGCVIYLNGREIFRLRMPSGPAGYSTYASASAPNHGNDLVRFSIAAAELRKGKNVLSIELHQSANDPGDAYIDCRSVIVFAMTVPQLIRGPYIQSANEHSAKVAWRTDFPTDGKVLVTDTKGDTRTFYNPLISTDHSVLVTGLPAGDVVTYKIGSSVHWLTDGPEYKIYTAPAADVIQPVRIWALGDFGNGSVGQQQVLQSYLTYLGNQRNDMWIWLGDNAYSFGLDSEYSSKVFNVYKDIFKSWNFYPAPGNHDYGFAGYQSAQALTTNFPYFDIFHLPTEGQSGGYPSGSEKYYSYDWSNIHFIALDSYGAYNDPDSPMFKWLKDDLRRNGKRWTIAYWHHPPYSMGTHNSDIEIEMVNMRNNIVPLLEKYGVDMVLTGHSHTYERSYFIRGHYGTELTFDSTMLVQPGDGGAIPYYKDSLHKGVVYVVCGVGGQQSASCQSSFPHAVMASAFTSVNGSSVIEIDHDTLVYKFLRSDGVIADSFSIVKSWHHEAEIIDPGIVDADIYPNPSSGIVTIRYRVPEKGELTVYRPDGSLLMNDTIYNDKTIDLSGNGSGLFLLTIKNSKGEKSFKAIIQAPEK